MVDTEKLKETKEENKHLPILANGRGLVLRSMDDIWRFACAVRDSGLAPKSFTKPEQILIAIQSGAELGMPPMRSLQSFCVVKGQARLWGDTPLALVRQSGLLESITETIEGEIGDDLTKTPDDVKAICITKRKGDPNQMRTEFSVKDARRARLWDDKDKPTWRAYPARMLKYRARSFNLRDNFPDAFGGSTIAEEFEGVDIPQAAPGPEVPGREERKQATDVKITDTAEATKEKLNECYMDFVKGAQEDLGVNFELLGLEDKDIWPTFAKFAESALENEFPKFDYTVVENYKLEHATTILGVLTLDGIPTDIVKQIPVPAEKEVEK